MEYGHYERSKDEYSKKQELSEHISTASGISGSSCHVFDSPSVNKFSMDSDKSSADSSSVDQTKNISVGGVSSGLSSSFTVGISVSSDCRSVVSPEKVRNSVEKTGEKEKHSREKSSEKKQSEEKKSEKKLIEEKQSGEKQIEEKSSGEKQPEKKQSEEKQSGEKKQQQEGIDKVLSSSDSSGKALSDKISSGSSSYGRRASAEKMAAAQRDISVSEFFAKNRHLLGFDNPRKALLTTVKEAVDNSLDACEEAGIMPEIWVSIEQTNLNHFRVSVQDNGPGIVRQQIPLIFGKLLYGSKFHRLRMSRGQQGIGISAAGMYGLLTTGKPTVIISKLSPRRPANYYQIRMDTKLNRPDILNGNGEGEEIPANDEGRRWIAEHEIDWIDVPHGTRVAIELEAKYQRGRGSVDEYLLQTAITNPHATLHYKDLDGIQTDYAAAVDKLPPEPVEIKPHPYGLELGRWLQLLQETKLLSVHKFLCETFSRVSSAIAKSICETAGISVRMSPQKITREESEKLFKTLQESKIPAPSTDCIVPVGEENLLAGLHKVVPGEFFVAATRPPAVYRGNPFQIEVGLAFGGGPSTQKVTEESLNEMLLESDARTIRQFLTAAFDGIGSDGADKLIKTANVRPRVSPAKMTETEKKHLLTALQTLNLSEGQSMNVYRYANRVPLQFQPGACLITQTVMQMNWRSYGLPQSRNQLPRGPVTLMVHLASVWVPFTSESKEAIASYPEIQKELRLGLQAVGRKLGMYLKRRERVKQEGARRNTFLRYLGEVATAVSSITGQERARVYDDLLAVAKVKTAIADAKLAEDGSILTESENDNDIGNLEDFGKNVLIVPSDSSVNTEDSSVSASLNSDAP